jgi:hypothetical protein
MSAVRLWSGYLQHLDQQEASKWCPREAKPRRLTLNKPIRSKGSRTTEQSAVDKPELKPAPDETPKAHAFRTQHPERDYGGCPPRLVLPKVQQGVRINKFCNV